MSAAEDKAKVVGEPDRFKLLFNNSRPKMPEGYSAPLSLTPTRQAIRERDQDETSTF